MNANRHERPRHTRPAAIEPVGGRTGLGDDPAPDAAEIDPWREIDEIDLRSMADAGSQIVECYRVLRKTDDNVVGEMLKGQGEFYEWDHYPKGDVYDSETHSQYYYHAHPADLRAGEHGHFHTFLRPAGMPFGIQPAPLPDYSPPKNDTDSLCHLIGIAMDSTGYPIRLFTTNRWLTGEIWYTADDVIAMLDRFDMDLAYPSWPVNIWISSILRLFRPEVVGLLRRRDRGIADWQAKHPGTNAYEDRRLEIVSAIDISVERQIRRVDRAMRRIGG